MKGDLSNNIDVIVIGAGHAGLSISYYLKQLGLDHLVFERNKTGDSWTSQRWDSFRLNTPNRVNLLPGLENTFEDGDGFCSASDFVSLLEFYKGIFHLPVIENSEVISVVKQKGSDEFSVTINENNIIKNYTSRQVVIASGAQNKLFLPSFAGNLYPEITQLHAADYRNESMLPPGAVFVAGSAQCGVQIAEDLLMAGRRVFLSTSKVGRVPRKYRGKDIVDWFLLTGLFDTKVSEVTDLKVLMERQPQISGTGPGGHTVSLQLLSKIGAVILGKVADADIENIYLRNDAAENVRYADEFSLKIKQLIDKFIVRSGFDSIPPEEDSGDLPDEMAACASPLSSLNFKHNNISTVIWATGFKGDYSYIKSPSITDPEFPRHNEGISEIEGMYFLGIPWLRKRKSGIICGIQEDAEFIAVKILSFRRNLRQLLAV